MFEGGEGVHRGCGWAQLGVIKLVIETKSAGYDLSGPKVTVEAQRDGRGSPSRKLPKKLDKELKASTCTPNSPIPSDQVRPMEALTHNSQDSKDPLPTTGQPRGSTGRSQVWSMVEFADLNMKW